MNREIELPVDFIEQDGAISIVSFKLPETRFAEPFSIDTISRQFNILDTQQTNPQDSLQLARPLHYDLSDPRVSVVPVEEFIKKYQDLNLDETRHFIFHMSRCGSTLATQMLATSDRFHVLVEPNLVNKLMDPAVVLPEGIDKTDLFRSTVNALEKTAPESAEKTIFKFRSWNSLYMQDMIGAFPKVKWLFTHRNGLEVLASVMKNPPGWLRSRETHQKYFEPFLKMGEVEDLERLQDDEYAIRMLGAFCRAAGEAESKDGTFLEYMQIKERLPSIIASNWELPLSEAERERMFERTALYSKDPEKSQEFKEDSESKRALASEHQRQLAEQYIESERKALFGENPSWTRELRPRLI